MGQLDALCHDVVGKVDGALACGVIDRTTSMVLALYRGRYREALDELRARPWSTCSSATPLAVWP